MDKEGEKLIELFEHNHKMAFDENIPSDKGWHRDVLNVIRQSIDARSDAQELLDVLRDRGLVTDGLIQLEQRHVRSLDFSETPPAHEVAPSRPKRLIDLGDN